MSMADTMFKSLVSAFGVSPEEMQKALTLLVTELSTLTAEREAFKLGAGTMVRHFNARLDAQDAKLSQIETLLERLSSVAEYAPVRAYLPAPPPSNGKDQHQ